MSGAQGDWCPDARGIHVLMFSHDNGEVIQIMGHQGDRITLQEAEEDEEDDDEEVGTLREMNGEMEGRLARAYEPRMKLAVKCWVECWVF